MRRPIALLTDFGRVDAYVGVVKGVILKRAPEATLVDLSHDVQPQDIRRAAFLLATSVRYFPPGTIFLTVVDPGVGTERAALALQAADWFLVGPDNGVLAWTLRFLMSDRQLSVQVVGDRLLLGAGCRAVELTERRFWLDSVSSTFHGRDIFGPAAAELSLGRDLAELGQSLEQIRDQVWPEPTRASEASIHGEVVTADVYGNLVTNLRADDLPPAPRFEIGGRSLAGLSHSFQSQAPLVAVLGSSGFVEIAVPNGSAATLLGRSVGLSVRVSSAA